jgi:hypothetical protein
VHSRSNSGDAYRVDTHEHTCNCKAGLCGNACWHQDAAYVAESVERADAFASEKQTAYMLPVMRDDEDMTDDELSAWLDELDKMDAEKGKVVA